MHVLYNGTSTSLDPSTKLDIENRDSLETGHIHAWHGGVIYLVGYVGNPALGSVAPLHTVGYLLV